MFSLRDNQTFFSNHFSSEAIEWSERFQNNGCDESVIEDILQQKLITNIPYLFNAYMKVLPDFRKYYKLSLIEMCCLSGELDAFQFVENFCNKQSEEYYASIKEEVSQLEKYKKEIENTSLEKRTSRQKIDYKCLPHLISQALSKPAFMPDRRILFYAAMSGQPVQLEQALKLMNYYDAKNEWENKIYKGMNILHAAILSGNVLQVNYVLELAKNEGIDLMRNITEDGVKIPPLHLSILSRSLETVKFILSHLTSTELISNNSTADDLISAQLASNESYQLYELDHEKFNALDYAIVIKAYLEANCPSSKFEVEKCKLEIQKMDDIETHLRKLKLTPTEQYKYFCLAGYEMPKNNIAPINKI